MKKWNRYAVSVVVMLLGLAATAGAGEVERHSGSVVSIAQDARSVVLAEIGPWHVKDGATVVTRRTIAIVPQTEFAVVSRMDSAPSGFAGDFVELRIGPDRIAANDYVTVECRHEGKRLVALKITVIELPGPATGEATR